MNALLGSSLAAIALYCAVGVWMDVRRDHRLRKDDYAAGYLRGFEDAANNRNHALYSSKDDWGAA